MRTFKVKRGVDSQVSTLQFNVDSISIVPSVYDNIQKDDMQSLHEVANKVRFEYETAVRLLKDRDPLAFDFTNVKQKIMEKGLCSILFRNNLIDLDYRNALSDYKIRIGSATSEISIRSNGVVVNRDFFLTIPENKRPSFFRMLDKMMMDYIQSVGDAKDNDEWKRNGLSERFRVMNEYLTPWIKENDVVLSENKKECFKYFLADDMQDIISLTVKKGKPVKVNRHVYEQAENKQEFERMVYVACRYYTDKVSENPNKRNYIVEKRDTYKKIVLPYLASIGIKAPLKYRKLRKSTAWKFDLGLSAFPTYHDYMMIKQVNALVGADDDLKKRKVKKEKIKTPKVNYDKSTEMMMQSFSDIMLSKNPDEVLHKECNDNPIMPYMAIDNEAELLSDIYNDESVVVVDCENESDGSIGDDGFFREAQAVIKDTIKWDE